MKKISLLCAFVFVFAMGSGFALAQDCTMDLDCADEYYCNGEETCDVDAGTCLAGVNPCAENELCDEENDACVAGVLVSLDIKPGSCPNPLNIRSRGVLPVAILGTEELDVTTIDPSTILLTREGVEGMVPVAPVRYGYEDVGTPSEGEPCDCDYSEGDEPNGDDLNGDGITDLTLKFRVPELVDGLALTDIASRETIPLTIMGETEDGTPLMGDDCVKIINPFQRWGDMFRNIKKPDRPKNPRAE